MTIYQSCRSASNSGSLNTCHTKRLEAPAWTRSLEPSEGSLPKGFLKLLLCPRALLTELPPSRMGRALDWLARCLCISLSTSLSLCLSLIRCASPKTSRACVEGRFRVVTPCRSSMPQARASIWNATPEMPATDTFPFELKEPLPHSPTRKCHRAPAQDIVIATQGYPSASVLCNLRAPSLRTRNVPSLTHKPELMPQASLIVTAMIPCCMTVQTKCRKAAGLPSQGEEACLASSQAPPLDAPHRFIDHSWHVSGITSAQKTHGPTCRPML